MGIWEEATAELNSETNADFFYHDPKTFKVKGGFGKVPLPWGEYPEGMVKNTKESNEYDLNRGRIYPLPHEIFEGRSLANVASQEQGTELNDPHFITASRLLHSYLNNSKSDINKRPSWLPVDAAQSAIDQRETGLDSEYYGGWGANFMNRFNMNITAMGVNTAKLINAPPGVQRALYYMLETSDREGVLASNVAKGLFNVAADPLSWVGLATLGIGTLGKESLKTMTKQGLKQFLEQSIFTNAGKVAMSTVKAPFSAIGIEAGFYTAADNLARQNVKINGGGQENFSAGEALESYALGATFGNTLKNTVQAAAPKVAGLVDGVKTKLSNMGDDAQARLDANENTTTMSSMGGGEFDNAIDKQLSKLAKKKEVDYLGFYSNALEQGKLLKQEKGTGQQFKQQLLKAGVKENELEWLDLDEIFSKDKVTKKEIIDAMRSNQIKVEEVLKETGSTYDDTDLLWDSEKTLTREEAYGDQLLDDIDKMKTILIDGGNAENGFLDVERAIKTAGLKYDSEAVTEAMRQAKNIYFDFGSDSNLGGVLGLNASADNPIKTKLIDKLLENDIIKDAAKLISDAEYSQFDRIIKITDTDTGYTITGNDEVGYLVFEKPELADDWSNALNNSASGERNSGISQELYSLEEAKIQTRAHAEEYGLVESFRESDAQFEKYTVGNERGRGGENYKELLLKFDSSNRDARFTKNKKTKLPDGSTPFREEAHWDEDDVFAHIRTTDRTINGKKTLFIEEIQSDWGQRGRKGFKLNANERVELKEQEYNLIAQKQELLDNPQFADRQQRLSEINDELYKIRTKTSQFAPDRMPFVENTDKWTSVAIKRILSYATENGYENVSFSPGHIHVERWNEPGLAPYYDSIIPKNLQKIVNKMEKGNVNKVYWDEVAYDTDVDTLGRAGDVWTVTITDAIRKKIESGQALFSAVPAAMLTGVAATQNGEQNGAQ